MLRNFIATPDQDAFDTIGSRQKILDDVISSSGSGSSINTMKNAPKQGIKFVDKSVMNPYVNNLVQKVTSHQPMAPIHKNSQNYRRQLHPQVIREYQQEANASRKKELLKRMERMFKEDPQTSAERSTLKQNQDSIKYSNVNHSYTAGVPSREGQYFSRTPTKPRTQRGFQKRRYITPIGTIQTEKAPHSYKKKTSPKLPLNVRNQLYVPSVQNQLYTPVLESHRQKGKKNDRFQMRRASNEFRVQYSNSGTQQMRQAKIRDIKMPNIKEFEDKGRSSKTFYSRNFKEPRTSATENPEVYQNPSSQYLGRPRQNFANIYSSDSNFQEEIESPEGRGLSEISLGSKPVNSFNHGSRGPSGVSSGIGFSKVNQNYSQKIHPVRPAVPRSLIRASNLRSTHEGRSLASRHYTPKRKFRPYQQVDPALETLTSGGGKRNYKILRRGAQGSPPEMPRAITRKIGTGHYYEPTFSHSASPTGERSGHNQSLQDNGPGTAFFPLQSQISSQPQDFDIELKVQSQEAKDFVKNSFREDGVLRKISGILINKVKNETDSSLKLQSLSKSELVDAEVMPPIIDCFDTNPHLLAQSKSPREQRYASPRNRSPDIQKVMSEAMYSLEKGSSAGVMSFRSSKSRELRSPDISVLPIDWADSLVYKDFLRGNLYFNSERNPAYYNEKDVDYILEMLKHKYREFKNSALTKPFFLKARNTLEKIMKDLTIAPQYENLERKYFEVNIENTLRFLIRTKLLMGARAYLIELFSLISRRDALSVSLMRILQSTESMKEYAQGSFEDPLTRGNIYDLNRDIKVVTSQIMKTLTGFQNDYKQFKGRFIFFDRDYIKVMRDDIKRIQSTLRNHEFQSTDRF